MTTTTISTLRSGRDGGYYRREPIDTWNFGTGRFTARAGGGVWSAQEEEYAMRITTMTGHGLDSLERRLFCSFLRRFLVWCAFVLD